MNIMYTIQIEKHNTQWVGMLDKVVNFNIQPNGSSTREKEVVANSHFELIQLMMESGFFLKMEQNI